MLKLFLRTIADEVVIFGAAQRNLLSSKIVYIGYMSYLSAKITSSFGLQPTLQICTFRSGANDATRATNKLCALQKSYDCPIDNIHEKTRDG